MKLENLPRIGEPLNGGFFAGLILVGIQTHALILSPKATGTGEFSWGEYGKDIPAKHYSDGKSNTVALAENNSEMAKWAIGLTINNFNDWYIPSRDELEVIYRNLKPTTDSNCCSFRDGDNPSALNVNDRYPYTENAPGITASPPFQKGGSEALAAAWHWSSTQHSAYGAWRQYFEDGYQDIGYKHCRHAARAVRRELII